MADVGGVRSFNFLCGSNVVWSMVDAVCALVLNSYLLGLRECASMSITCIVSVSPTLIYSYMASELFREVYRTDDSIIIAKWDTNDSIDMFVTTSPFNVGDIPQDSASAKYTTMAIKVQFPVDSCQSL